MHHRRSRPLHLATLVSLALLIAGVALLTSEATGYQKVAGVRISTIDGRSPIRSLPFTIDECGSYYVARCLTGTSGSAGITIDADDVTLDLNGFALVGVPGSLDGIFVPLGRVNVTVENGTVRNWGGGGVIAWNCGYARIDGVKAYLNGGVGIAVASEGLVNGCTSAGNGEDGIMVGFGSIVRGSIASDNGQNGIVALPAASATGSVIEGCTARSNSLVGILAGDGSTISGSSVTLNATGGISLGLACTVEGSSVVLNGGNGINAFDSLVRGNTSRSNSGTSINAPTSTVLENHQ